MQISLSAPSLSFKDFVQSLSERNSSLPTLKKKRLRNIRTLDTITNHGFENYQYLSLKLENNINLARNNSNKETTRFQTDSRFSYQDLSSHRFKTLETNSASPNKTYTNQFKMQQQRRIVQQKSMLIRNQQLFNEVVQKCQKYRSMKKYSLECKPTESIISKYLSELSQKREIAKKPQGLEEVLDHETTQLYSDIVNDKYLKQKFPKNNASLKQNIRALLNVYYEEAIYFDEAKFRSIHAGLNLKRIHFFRFKYHFMTKYIAMNVTPEKLFKGCERIENYRALILNEETEFDIYGQEDGINLISKLMYQKIFADCTLSEYFSGIELEDQAHKFARLFYQLIYHFDSPNYSNEVLRERHAKYQLTPIHLTNFKFYLSKTLAQLEIPFKHRRSLLRRMDIYKYAILNKDDHRTILNNYGYKQFVDDYVRECCQDPSLHELVVKRGKNSFTIHCENIFYYFFHHNIKAITKDDIEQIHQHKNIINDKIFNKLKEKTIVAFNRLTNDKLLLSDLEEDWDEVKPLVLGYSYQGFIKSMGGQKLLQQWTAALESEFHMRHLHLIFENEDVSMRNTIMCKLNLLCYGVRFYKKTDLEIIHKRFKINQYQYYDFEQSFKVVLGDNPQFKFILQLISEYKKHIISE